MACASLGIALIAVNLRFWNTDVMFLENKDRLVRKTVRKRAGKRERKGISKITRKRVRKTRLE